MDTATITTEDAGVVVRKGIPYARHGNVELRGDLYLPAGDGPFPVVVAAPGGGWRLCDPRAAKVWGPFLAMNGIALFGFNYRVADKTKMFPEAVCDVVSAIQFVRGAADELGIDPARIAMLGSSAGAHVGALATLGGDSPHFRNAQPANDFSSADASVKAFAGIYGVYDLFALWQQEIADITDPKERRSECLIGAPPFANRQSYFDASPISYVRYAVNTIPMFIAYGTADETVNPQFQTIPFIGALKQAGFMVRDFPVIGAGHFWFGEESIDDPRGYTGYIAPRLLRFFKQFL
ncbi:alpha/beta hydrolase [Rhizobium sullae]|uniref:alpha/beta hydrolase n=1 Tax=Rhizobium sullae TaxID=50338 RepID=UPI0015C671A1|nr:alpha/beta hydrolase [Rhizobium sullae]